MSRNLFPRHPCFVTGLFAPHSFHIISHTGLVGGGNWPHLWEISLARHGVLFLNELREFGMRVLELLCLALQDKVFAINREQGSQIFPASF